MSESQLFTNFEPDYDVETPCFRRSIRGEFKSSVEPQEQEIIQDHVNISQSSKLESEQEIYAQTTLQQSFTHLSLSGRTHQRQINTSDSANIRGLYFVNEIKEIQTNPPKKVNKKLLQDERFKILCLKNNLTKQRLRVKPLKYWLGQTKRTLKNDGIQILKRLSVCQAITGLQQCRAIHSSTYLHRSRKPIGWITINQHSQININDNLYRITKICSDLFGLTLEEQTLVISKFGQKQSNYFRSSFSRIRNDFSSKVKLKIILLKVDSKNDYILY